MSAATPPLDCAALDERLLDFLYEEIPDDERSAIEAHVAGCARCTAEVAAFRRVRQAARAMPMEEPSPDVSERLLEAAAGRNVVPLPLLGRGLEPPVVDDGDAEPSLAATERILAAARARVAAAPAAARASMTATTTSGASGEVVALAAAQAASQAARSAKRRRWYTSPSLAAAASFVLVGAGTAWFLSFNREPVAVLAEKKAMAPAADVRSATDDVAPAEAARKVVAPGTTPIVADRARNDTAAAEAKAPAVALDKLRASGSRPAGAPYAQLAPPERELADQDRLSRSAEGLGEALGTGGGGQGYGGGLGALGTGQGRLAQPVAAAPPAPARKPDGSGVTLHSDEKRVLEESVAAMKKESRAPRESLDDLLDGEPDPGARPRSERAFAPPPPASPSYPSASASAAAPPAAAEPQAPRAAGGAAARDTGGDALSNGLANRMPCDDYLRTYRASQTDRAPTGPEQLRAADCLARAGQVEQARAEYATLRQRHPELSSQIDQRLARLDGAEATEASQRRAAANQAAPAAPPKAKVKAAPSRQGKATDSPSM